MFFFWKPAQLAGGDEGQLGVLWLALQSVQLGGHPHVVLDVRECKETQLGITLSHLLDGEVGAVCGKLAAPLNFASPAQRTIRSRWFTTSCGSGIESS